VSPIFIRPVREQAEHDRLIRHLQAKYTRKFETLANPGDEQIAPVKIGTATFFPDLVLSSGKKLAGLVEVESGESVNKLEAMAQWVHFSRARVPFHLYVPVQAYDAARRLCEENQARVSELWTYRPGSDGFDLVRMSTDASAAGAAPRTPGAARTPIATKPAAAPRPQPVKPAPKPAGAARAKAAAPAKAKATAPKTVKPAKPAARAVRPARKATAAKPARKAVGGRKR
jgi:hypothetical protein